ncbi:TPA: hypothetical protein ACS7ZY_002376 [Providencia alcalifaciens]
MMIKPPLLLPLILCSPVWLFGYAQAAVELHRGFNELGTASANIKGSNGVSFSKPDWDGLAFNVSRSNASSRCQSPNQDIKLITLDAYTGYQFTPGMLLVLYSGTISGTRDFNWGLLGMLKPLPYSYTFSPTGVLSPQTYTEAAWCADPRTTQQGLGTVNLSGQGGSTTGSVKVGIYVPENTPLGTTGTLESLYINRGTPSDVPDSAGKIIGTGVEYVVVGQLACTVLAPPIVDFRNVRLSGNETDGTILANETGNVTVNCSGDADAELDATMSVTGTQARYTNTLKMNMVDSTAAAPAEIRGLIGPGIVQTGVCDGNSSHLGWIQFTNKNQNIAAGKLKSGSNTIPYNFTLCSTGAYTLGVAEATATLNIYWN